MSIQSYQNFEKIIMCLSVLRYIFKSRSKKGLYDLNKKAEPFFNSVLNMVYGWDLNNLNEIQSNYPTIDLGDIKAKVCVQITAENGATKISKTISKFIEKKLYSHYTRLIILIITDKKNYSSNFQTNGKLSFSKSDDIKDMDDLLTDIEKLPIDRLTELYNFLEKELSAIISVTAEPNSLLARAEKRITLPPQSGEKLFVHLQYEKEGKKRGLSDLKRFYKSLTALPKKTREYLYFIVWNGSKQSVFGGNDRITIHPRKLESLLRLSRETSSEEFRILEEAGIASYDEDEPPPVIEISFFMDTGVELLSVLKEFSESESVLYEIIVNCNFTKLDAG